MAASLDDAQILWVGLEGLLMPNIKLSKEDATTIRTALARMMYHERDCAASLEKSARESIEPDGVKWKDLANAARVRAEQAEALLIRIRQVS